MRGTQARVSASGHSPKRKAPAQDREAGNLFHGVASGQGLWTSGGHKLTASAGTRAGADLSAGTTVRTAPARLSGPSFWVQSPKPPSLGWVWRLPLARYSSPISPSILPPALAQRRDPSMRSTPGGEIKAARSHPPASAACCALWKWRSKPLPAAGMPQLHAVKLLPVPSRLPPPLPSRCPACQPASLAASPNRQRKRVRARGGGSGRRCQASGASPPPHFAASRRREPLSRGGT